MIAVAILFGTEWTGTDWTGTDWNAVGLTWWMNSVNEFSGSTQVADQMELTKCLEKEP